ncbi:hypothetical protein HZH66_011832 [Vespula vulgaris]|uniref:Uncharacterized protein n=1 Tax=Vespula vulgaris TaxID=7454 RepID=A0A834JDG6_VESVU|nr:hypothetical protein HZH66_011832 [Vespula vulgaris]
MASPSRVGNLTGRTLGGGDGGGGDATASALLLCIIKSYDNVGECEVQKSPLNPPPPPPFSSHPVLPSERVNPLSTRGLRKMHFQLLSPLRVDGPTVWS